MGLVRACFRLGARCYGAWIGLFSPTPPFFDPAAFPWVRELEAHWATIRTELDAVLKQHAAPPLASILPGEDAIAEPSWKAFVLLLWNRPVEANLVRCPRTGELLRAVPGLTTAFFSILEPRTHIPPHRGPFRGVVRYHLGLYVPEPDACRIRVGNEIRHWQEGKSLIFDDTFDHEVWHEGTLPRVVLFLDVKRPLPLLVRWSNDLLMAVLARLVIYPSARWSKMAGGDMG